MNIVIKFYKVVHGESGKFLCFSNSDAELNAWFYKHPEFKIDSAVRGDEMATIKVIDSSNIRID